MEPVTDPGTARKSIFIKWFPYDKRNETIAAAIGAQCRFVNTFRKRAAWTAPLRYLADAVATLRLLAKERPGTVFVTNPPIFAAGTVALYCMATGASFIIDSHTGAFSPKWRWFEGLHRYLARRARLVIVTNRPFENAYRELGAQTCIVADLVMDIPKTKEAALPEGFHVVAICSYDPDEPIGEILGAAREAPEVSFHLTGNYRRAGAALLATAPPNVSFTGFLPDEEYFALLHAADAIMVLVKEDNTMQQGAYEAVSIKKPMILSDWQLLRETYPRGTVFVRNDGRSIAAGVRELITDYRRYAAEMEELYWARKRVWERNCSLLEEVVSGELPDRTAAHPAARRAS